MKKKLLMCYHSAEFGGVERQIYDIIKGLSSEIDITVVCPDGPLVKEYLDAGAIKHIDLKPSFEADFGYSMKIRKILLENNIDIIHSHELLTGSLATFGAWMARTEKRIYHVHTPFSQWRHKSLKRYPALIINTIVNSIVGNLFATDVLALTDTVKEIRIKKEFILPSKIVIIPNAVDIKELSVERNARDVLKVSDNEYLLGNLARFTEEKGHRKLIKAFASLVKKENEILSGSNYKRIKLLFAGGGDLLDEIKEMAKSLDVSDRVIFTGKFRDGDKVQLLHSIDLFTFPTYTEGFGISVIEALGAGIPVIATDLPILRDVCGDDIKYLSVDIVDDLAVEIEHLVSNKEYRMDRIAKGKERAAMYSLEVFWNNYRKLYLG